MSLATGTNVTLEAALREAEERFVAANPTSRRLHARAAEVMPGGNTRTVLFYDPFPLTLARGEGCYVWDADEHAYTDFLVEYTAGLYGHSNPVIQGAVEAALSEGIVLGGPNLLEAGFAAALCDRFPAVERIRFCNSGTEANLFALSAARAATGRQKVVAFKGGYHGGVLYFAGPNPLNAPFPIELADYNDSEGATALIAALGGDLAAVIVEPMLGSGGCIPAELEFLQALRVATEKTGALLIFDEVMTSRLAPGGLHGALGLTPDLVTLGKYLGGGLTFGAFGGRADIMDRFDPRRADAWPHAGTFNNNVLTMAAGLAGLTQIYTPKTAVTLNKRGDKLRLRLNAAAAKLGLPVQVTGRGSMMCLHVAGGPVRRPGDVTMPKALRDLLHFDLLAAGQYIARRGMINLSLPMTDSDLDGLVEAFAEMLETRRSLIEPTA
ncbi:aspartate aminotransferase family protein [Oceanibaculum pacificum]|uniref:Glutamate-1-semialdehyde 2,1-aminomutase n=1 Tax=Oceanibaculum pacificum TaxID=580166 RepID=A0A154VZT0_9PROT|nr:aspartate aminotransferase family protein [Oceanibaculum pacificum]KZD06775.1 glutamate-1-semialdehyde 2,1-aminomutase [Oceanibaculum pacificum]